MTGGDGVEVEAQIGATGAATGNAAIATEIDDAAIGTGAAKTGTGTGTATETDDAGAAGAGAPTREPH